MSTQFKLDSLQAVGVQEEEGAWVDITHPGTGEPLYLGGQKEKPLRIKVVGSYSETYRNLVKKQKNELYKNPRRQMDADLSERKELSTLSTCTIEWEGAFDDTGAPIPFSRQNVEAVYSAARFIADQVDTAITDHARFFVKSSGV